MQKMEGLHYVTSLYLNTGHYTIRIFPAIQGMKMIVTKFWQLRYNYLLMRICTSGDIYQDKVDKLLGETNGIKTYIYILVLRKER